MKDVEYFSPETLDEAAALLMAADSQAPPLARGTDLIAQPREGERMRSIVLDLQRIPELNRLEYDERNGLRIGAAIPFASILEFPPARRLYPMLADGFRLLGPPETQALATLGGSLGQATPSQDLGPPLICLRASAAIFGPHGWSELGVEALFPRAGRTGLQPGEFVVDVRLPAAPPRSNGAYLRAAPQEEMNIGMLGVGAFLVMEEDLATCCGARLALGALAPEPLRALEAERFLAGKRLEDVILREAGELAARSVRPGNEAGESAEGLLVLVRVLTPRAILGALQRVRAGATA